MNVIVVDENDKINVSGKFDNQLCVIIASDKSDS